MVDEDQERRKCLKTKADMEEIERFRTTIRNTEEADSSTKSVILKYRRVGYLFYECRQKLPRNIKYYVRNK